MQDVVASNVLDVLSFKVMHVVMHVQSARIVDRGTDFLEHIGNLL